MAKRARRTLPARKKKRAADSLLIRSAESLGRVIGSLQRQMQGRSKRVTAMANDAIDTMPTSPRVKNRSSASSPRRSRSTRKASTRETARASKAGGRRKRATSRRAAKKR